MRRDDDARLDSLLSGLPPGPPAAFTDDVMRRVRAMPRPAPVTVPSYPEPVMPWWTRALLQPATLGAFVVAAIFAVWSDELLRGSMQLSSALASRMVTGSQELPGWSGLVIATSVGSVLVAYLAVRGARIFLDAAEQNRAPAGR
jgi:hypothetical protein